MDSYKARKTERRDGAAHPHLYDTQSALFSSLFIQAVLSPLSFSDDVVCTAAPQSRNGYSLSLSSFSAIQNPIHRRCNNNRASIMCAHNIYTYICGCAALVKVIYQYI